MSVNFLATSVPSEPENFAVTSGFYPINRTSVGVLVFASLIRRSLDTKRQGYFSLIALYYGKTRR